MKYRVFATVVSVVILSAILHAAPSGAIFTTTANGSRVNANQYVSKCDVYLNGGPGPNAPASAAGLPNGDYYFQVTDPSGSQLLSTDSVSNRQFRVEGGVIRSYTGNNIEPFHPTYYDQNHPELNAITIRLANIGCPGDFRDSPNGGGVYKVWATPVADYAAGNCGNGCFHGFIPSKSKTDNFRVNGGAGTFCLTVWKRVVDQGLESPGAQWKISLFDPAQVTNDYYTGPEGFLQVCGLSAGAYTVTEELQGLNVIGLIVNGMSQAAESVYSFVWSIGKPEPVIMFKNGTDIDPDA
jgi:hypothetical protein